MKPYSDGEEIVKLSLFIFPKHAGDTKFLKMIDHIALLKHSDAMKWQLILTNKLF